MAACRRVYDLRYQQADCQEPRSAPQLYAGMDYLYLFTGFANWSSCAVNAPTGNHVFRTLVGIHSRLLVHKLTKRNFTIELKIKWDGDRTEKKVAVLQLQFSSVQLKCCEQALSLYRQRYWFGMHTHDCRVNDDLPGNVYNDTSSRKISTTNNAAVDVKRLRPRSVLTPVSHFQHSLRLCLGIMWKHGVIHKTENT